jgi:monofunctional biosynthetic peptidoglycan transglycosylase
MLIRAAAHVASGKGPRLDKTWRPLDRISPRLAEAVVASEDQRFFIHHGFDFDAIGSAFTANGRGRRKLGASTISQQTAKNLFLWPDRTWLRKGLEAYFTLLLEVIWPKRRILEVYLNIIETGDGTYGVEAAARRYFGISAADLNASQAALIAATLPNPRAWSPANPTGYLRRRQTWILRQMDQLGPMPDGLSQGGPRSAPPAVPPRPRDLGNRRDTAAPAGPAPAESATTLSPPAAPPAGSPAPQATPPDEAPPYPEAEPIPAPAPESAAP